MLTRTRFYIIELQMISSMYYELIVVKMLSTSENPTTMILENLIGMSSVEEVL